MKFNNQQKRSKSKLNFSNILPVGVVSLVLCLGLVQLWASHRLSTNGEKLKQIEADISNLETQNMLLADEVNKMGSLAEISQRAQKLGLIKSSLVLNITPRNSVALNH